MYWNSLSFKNIEKKINTSRILFVLCTAEKAERLCEGHETRHSGTGARETELHSLPVRAKEMTMAVSSSTKLYRLFVEQMRRYMRGTVSPLEIGLVHFQGQAINFLSIF